MIAMRSLLTLVRVVGVLALVLVLYAWMYPARFGEWLSKEHGAKPFPTPDPVVAVPATKAPAVQSIPVPAEPAVLAAPAQTPSVVGTAPAAPTAVPAVPQPGNTTAAPAAGSATAAATPPAAAPAEALKPLPPITLPKPVPVSKSQAAMAQWLGSKYRVAPAALESLIVEADKLSKTYKLSPNLIIAVMAIESNFHPYIQSEAGAQGLMQVMPRVHAKRYEKYGGKSSFIDPMVSLKVGAEILHDCVKLKDGSETEALRFYFGGGASSQGYIDKVRAEQSRLNQIAAGSRVPVE